MIKDVAETVQQVLGNDELEQHEKDLALLVVLLKFEQNVRASEQDDVGDRLSKWISTGVVSGPGAGLQQSLDEMYEARRKTYGTL